MSCLPLTPAPDTSHASTLSSPEWSPPPAPLTSTERRQRGQQALLELISLCRTLECQPKLAVTQTPVVEDGIHLVVHQAWPQGTLQGSLRGRRGVVSPLQLAAPAPSPLSAALCTSSPSNPTSSAPQLPAPAGAAVENPLLLAAPLTPQSCSPHPYMFVIPQ